MGDSMDDGGEKGSGVDRALSILLVLLCVAVVAAFGTLLIVHQL